MSVEDELKKADAMIRAGNQVPLLITMRDEDGVEHRLAIQAESDFDKDLAVVCAEALVVLTCATECFVLFEAWYLQIPKDEFDENKYVRPSESDSRTEAVVISHNTKDATTITVAPIVREASGSFLDLKPNSDSRLELDPRSRFAGIVERAQTRPKELAGDVLCICLDKFGARASYTNEKITN